MSALEDQKLRPDRIIVVDNASTDGTSDYLQALGYRIPQIQVISVPENEGPAGGFARGLQAVLDAQQFSHAWVMDDDVFPSPHCLAQLMAEWKTDEVLYPASVDEWGIPNNTVAWAGLLLPVAPLRRLGVPRADLFWWIEDTEFVLWRLRAVGRLTLRWSKIASVVHLKRRTQRRPAWKYYYEARNCVYYHLRIRRSRYWKLVRSLVLLSAGIFRAPSIAKARYLSLGVLDGLRGRLGKRVDPLLTI